MSDTVQLIKEKLSVTDVVGQYVKLTRAGKYWKGLSPFTKEKTPSFFVSPDRGLYHCFSTGKGGDMFTFVEEMEGVDFKGALKLLAEKAGVPLVYESGASDEREKIFKALEAARAFFKENLGKHTGVMEYITSRAVLPKTIETWSIGYAEDEWRTLYERLTTDGIAEGILERAGLIKKSDAEGGGNRFYDRFRGRVMFPIKDVSGRVIGFSGRIFKDDPEHPGAKYLNSPETAVFDKSRALHGMYEAREGIRNLNSAILVEGQFDLLMAHQAGYTNTIATSGTSFTDKHAEAIKRYTPNLLIAYDGDRAGIAAAGRAAGIALPMGMNVKIARLPAGEDPADVIKRNPEIFRAAVREAVHIVDFYIAHITDAKYDPRRFKLEVSRTVLPYIAMIPNKIDQAYFTERVAEALSVPVEAVRDELRKVTAQPKERREGAAEPQPFEPFLSRADSIERTVLGLMLLFKEKGMTPEALKAETALREAVGDERLLALTAKNEETRPAVFEAEFFLESHGDRANEVVDDVYADLKRETLHETYRETLASLRSAEKTGDEAQAASLMGELSRLAKLLR